MVMFRSFEGDVVRTQKAVHVQLVQELGDVGSPCSGEVDGCVKQVTEAGDFDGQDEILKAAAGGLADPTAAGLTGELNTLVAVLTSSPEGPCLGY